MGQKQPKQHKHIPINRNKFELTLKKVVLHVKLQRDRRQGSLRKKEKELLKLLNRKCRNQKDEYIKGSSIVSDQSFVDACNICMRFVDILKDKSINIVESRGDHTKIQEVVPYMISVLWAGKPLNIPVFGELYNMMYGFFGPGIQVCIEQEQQVDAELKSLFKNLMPTPIQVNLYFRKFCDKYDLDVEKFNAVGHQAPGDDVCPQDQPSYPGANFGQGGQGGGQVQMQPQQQQQQYFQPMQPMQQQQQPQNNFNMLPMENPEYQQPQFQQPQPQQQQFQQPSFGDGNKQFDLDLDNLQKFDMGGGQQQPQKQNNNDIMNEIDAMLSNQNQQQNQQFNQQPMYPDTNQLHPSQAKPYVPQQPGNGAFPPPC